MLPDGKQALVFVARQRFPGAEQAVRGVMAGNTCWSREKECRVTYMLSYCRRSRVATIAAGNVPTPTAPIRNSATQE